MSKRARALCSCVRTRTRVPEYAPRDFHAENTCDALSFAVTAKGLQRIARCMIHVGFTVVCYVGLRNISDRISFSVSLWSWVSQRTGERFSTSRDRSRLDVSRFLRSMQGGGWSSCFGVTVSKYPITLLLFAISYIKWLLLCRLVRQFGWRLCVFFMASFAEYTGKIQEVYFFLFPDRMSLVTIERYFNVK